mmetsp:Transcript_80448/g.145218  ORF Transcript_80448/g.145218 Transcript_80448/m.145218 type:complete len:246 (-) Transcript_80448:649-1386(-)
MILLQRRFGRFFFCWRGDLMHSLRALAMVLCKFHGAGGAAFKTRKVIEVGRRSGTGEETERLLNERNGDVLDGLLDGCENCSLQGIYPFFKHLRNLLSDTPSETRPLQLLFNYNTASCHLSVSKSEGVQFLVHLPGHLHLTFQSSRPHPLNMRKQSWSKHLQQNGANQCVEDDGKLGSICNETPDCFVTTFLREECPRQRYAANCTLDGSPCYRAKETERRLGQNQRFADRITVFATTRSHREGD